jgi:hypothetical protein
MRAGKIAEYKNRQDHAGDDLKAYGIEQATHMIIINQIRSKNTIPRPVRWNDSFSYRRLWLDTRIDRKGFRGICA